jgi:NADH:ubiquinone oxidoreductase subunit 2 (subunit N)
VCHLMMSEWGGWVAAGASGLLLVLVLLSIAALVKYLFVGSRRREEPRHP